MIIVVLFLLLRPRRGMGIVIVVVVCGTEPPLERPRNRGGRQGGEGGDEAFAGLREGLYQGHAAAAAAAAAPGHSGGGGAMVVVGGASRLWWLLVPGCGVVLFVVIGVVGAVAVEGAAGAAGAADGGGGADVLDLHVCRVLCFAARQIGGKMSQLFAIKEPTTSAKIYRPDLAIVRFQVSPRGVLRAVEAADVGPAEVGVLQGLFCVGGFD